MTSPAAPPPAKPSSFWRYLKEAFTFRWNLLFFGAATVVAVMSGAPDVVLPLVGAAEIAYLGMLATHPKFRAASDAQAHHAAKGPEAAAPPLDRQVALAQLVVALDTRKRQRFAQLRARCVEMRDIARGMRGSAEGSSAADDIRTPALDRLLWVFLKLLSSQQSLERFLDSTDAEEIAHKLSELEKRQEASAGEADERILKSLGDSIATTRLRLENVEKSRRNAEFVTVELDRIEGKIQALTEMSVSHQDPDFISSQVDSVAHSMVSTERAIAELHHITGLSEDLEEAPPIMETEVGARG